MVSVSPMCDTTFPWDSLLQFHVTLSNTKKKFMEKFQLVFKVTKLFGCTIEMHQ